MVKKLSLFEGFNFLDHILLSFHFIHCFPEFLTFLNLMVSQPSFHPMSSLISTILNSIFLGLHSIYSLPRNSTFQVPIFSNLHFSFLSHIELFISYICSAFSSSIVFFGFNCPKLSISPTHISSNVLFSFIPFHLIHCLSQIQHFPIFSIFPNPYIIHYLSNSQLLTPNMSTKRPIIVLRLEDSTTIYNSNTLSQTFGEWQSQKLILRKYE